jgi:hypothetical protein
MQNTKSRVVEGKLADKIREQVKDWVADEIKENLELIRVTHLWLDRYRIDWFCLIEDPASTVKQRFILDTRFVHVEETDGGVKVTDFSKGRVDFIKDFKLRE